MHGLGGDPDGDRVAYQSVLAAWRDYLAHDNHGRPFVLIGHSQGAAMLITLMQNEIDGNPALRRRMVSAVILGGNVATRAGSDVGGTFASIPACRSTSQTRCVIAYSSYLEQPQEDSLFGIPGQGVSLQSAQTQRSGLQVLCTNPAALGHRGPAALDSYFIASHVHVSVPTPWVAYRGLYTGSCDTDGQATWLQITRTTAELGPQLEERSRMGLHAEDVNLALGNLVHDVSLEEAAFR